MKEGKWKSDIFVQSGFFFFFCHIQSGSKSQQEEKKPKKLKTTGHGAQKTPSNPQKQSNPQTQEEKT